MRAYKTLLFPGLCDALHNGGPRTPANLPQSLDREGAMEPFSGEFAYAVCAGLIAIYAWDRFNTPLSNRSSTLRTLFWSSCIGYVLSASRFRTDGYRDHSEADRRLGNAKFTLRPDADSTAPRR